MASNRPHTLKDEQYYQRQYQPFIIPEDVKATLIALRDEIGAESYEKWCDAFILEKDNWQRVKAIAARTLDEIQARK